MPAAKTSSGISFVTTLPAPITDLVPIVIAINGKTDKQFTTTNLFGIRFYGGLAAVNNAVSFNGTLTFANNNSIFPKLTGGIDFIPNKVNQRLFFRLEISAGSARDTPLA